MTFFLKRNFYGFKRSFIALLQPLQAVSYEAHEPAQ